MAGGNAIGDRLDRLGDQWNEFAQDGQARLLRWVVRQDEYRMIEAFIMREQDDRAGEIPDLFLRFTEPFENLESYAEALRRSLIEQYEAARAELEEEASGEGGEPSDAGKAPEPPIDLSWSPPSPDGKHSLNAFIEACASLHAHHADSMEKLAVFLTPTTTSSDADWQRWLHALAERLPDEVRVAVVDAAEAPVLGELAEALPGVVVNTEAGLDMPAAITQLARAGGTSEPGGQFRVKFAALAQSLGKGDLKSAEGHATGARAVAQENGWSHLGAAVDMALAGGYLTAGRHADAIGRYREVDAAGAELEKREDPVGVKLRLQAGLGAAGVLFASQDYPAAAAAYQGAVVHAQAAQDQLMLVECWRMAAYCHEQAGDTTGAWECGMQALDAAEAIPPEQRVQSTLPHAGEGLLRVAGHSPRHVQLIDERLSGLLGTVDWRALATAGPVFS